MKKYIVLILVGSLIFSSFLVFGEAKPFEKSKTIGRSRNFNEYYKGFL